MAEAEEPEQLHQEIVRAMQQAGMALPLDRIRAALPKAQRPGRKDLCRLLAQLEQRGMVFIWPRRRFALRPFDTFLRERICKLLEGGPRTRAELAARLPAAPKGRLKELLRALTREGRIYRHPSRGRREPYGLKPADAADYLEPQLSQALDAIARKGFARSAVGAALARCLSVEFLPAESGDTRAVLDAMTRLDPRVQRGALVPLPHLRMALADRLTTTQAFNRAILALAGQHLVQLQLHPNPTELAKSERDALIPSGTGGYYMSIGLQLKTG
ncbi:MAG: hypothetical protein MUF51_10020 [Vicinamibacteria bacterium]|jgi:hypothetical protein|nr:hypothetical protein [Vicinamibacteria bacterium]